MRNFNEEEYNMSAASGIMRLPITESIAMKLAYRIGSVNPNWDKIRKLFSENAVFRFPDRDPMNLSQFETFYKAEYVGNVTQCGTCQDDFEPVAEDSENVVWKSSGYEHRQDSGLNRINTEIELQFVVENGVTKIAHFHVKKRERTECEHGIDKDVSHLALSEQHTRIRKLAYRSFQTPQQNDKLMKLYSEKATFVYRDGRVKSREEFAESMRIGNTENEVVLGKWSNSYHSVDGAILWRTGGYQWRLGKGWGEEGKGLYKIEMYARFTFGEDFRILQQKELNYSKDKISET